MISGKGWLDHRFRKYHLIIRWLPSKPAAWIGENFGHELQIPPSATRSGRQGELRELNAILENNLVPSRSGKG